MRWIVFAFALLFSTAASAQCNGSFAPNTFCGAGPSGGLPGQIPFSSLPSIPLSSADIDNICATNNAVLIRLTGTWQCGLTGTSGHVIPFLDGTNTWSAPQTLTVGVLNSQQNGLLVSATLPTGDTHTNNGIFFDVVSAGSSPFTQRVQRNTLEAGYTGSGTTLALDLANLAAGVGGSIPGAESNQIAGNIAFGANVTSTTTGDNWGGVGHGQGSSGLNVGFSGYAQVSSPGAANIGLWGGGYNASGPEIGMLATCAVALTPTVSGALAADNGTCPIPVFVGMVQEITKVTIDQNGNLILAIPLATASGGTGGTSPSTARTSLGVAPGTGLTQSGNNLNSSAETIDTFAPGFVSSIVNTKVGFTLWNATSIVDNVVGSAQSLTCTGNPIVTFYECGTDATCGSPTGIAAVLLSSTGRAFPASAISAQTISAAHYTAWAVSSGTCVALNMQAKAQAHAQ